MKRDAADIIREDGPDALREAFDRAVKLKQTLNETCPHQAAATSTASAAIPFPASGLERQAASATVAGDAALDQVAANRVGETARRPVSTRSEKREMRRRVRLGDLRRLLRARCGPILPDDDAGREYLHELLLPISVGPYANIKMANAIEIWAPWMPQEEAQSLIDRTLISQRMPTARQLGERMGLTNAERERLRLKTIAACDLTLEQALQWRKAKRRARMRRLRRLRGAMPQATSTNRLRPWEREGISRATWYRRRETDSCPVRLSNTGHKTVSPKKSRPPGDGPGKKKSALASKRNAPTKPEKPQTQRGAHLTVRPPGEVNGYTCLTDDLTALEVNAHTCAIVTAPELGARTCDTAAALRAYARLAVIASESYGHAVNAIAAALKASKVGFEQVSA
jgi:hypothetical protein